LALLAFIVDNILLRMDFILSNRCVPFANGRIFSLKNGRVCVPMQVGIFGGTSIWIINKYIIQNLRQKSNNNSVFLLQQLPNKDEQGTMFPFGPKSRKFFSKTNTFVGNNEAHRAGGGSHFDTHTYGVTPLTLFSDNLMNKIEQLKNTLTNQTLTPAQVVKFCCFVEKLGDIFVSDLASIR